MSGMEGGIELRGEERDDAPDLRKRYPLCLFFFSSSLLSVSILVVEEGHSIAE